MCRPKCIPHKVLSYGLKELLSYRVSLLISCLMSENKVLLKDGLHERFCIIEY